MDSLTEVKALEAAETGGFEGRNLKEVRMTSSLIRCSVLALAAAALPAQDMRVTAHVPFGFEVQGKSMPAGDYVVSLLNTNSVILKCQEHSVIVSSNALLANGREGKGALVFHRYGDQYFLAEFWGGSNNGREFRPTRLEREVAARVAPEKRVIRASR